jgi:hypothetical protein
VHSSVVTGGQKVYVALDDLSVVLGPNDSGKTRLLAVLYDTLAAHFEEPEPTPIALPDYDATLFMALNFEDMQSACGRALSALIDEEAPETQFGARPLNLDPAWLEELDAAGAVSDDAALDVWLELMRRAADLMDSAWDPLFGALRTSLMISVTAGDPPEVHIVLDVDTARKVSADRLGCAVDGHWPVPVEPLGKLPGVRLEPMWLPNAPGLIHRELATGLIRCVEAARAVDGDDPNFDDNPW